MIKWLLCCYDSRTSQKPDPPGSPPEKPHKRCWGSSWYCQLRLPCTSGAGHREVECSVGAHLAAYSRPGRKPSPFPALQRSLPMPTGKGNILEGPTSISAEQAVKVDFCSSEAINGQLEHLIKHLVFYLIGASLWTYI